MLHPNHRRPPDFVIAGAPRCASTYTQNLLRMWSDVYMLPGEVPLFEDPYYGPNTVNELGRLLPERKQQAVFGFKCPTYLSNPVCARRLKKDIPDIKVVVLVRDPVQRAVSDYYYKMQAGRLPVARPEVGLADVLSGRTNNPNTMQIIEFGLYGRQIEAYLQQFPRSQLLVLRTARSPAEVQSNGEALAQFIGLQSIPQQAGQATPKSNAGIYSINALRLLSLINRIRYRPDEDRRMSRNKHGLNKVADRCCAALHRAVSTAVPLVCENRPPSLPEDIIEGLSARFRDDSLELQRLTGLDLSDWSSVRCAAGGGGVRAAARR